MVVGAPASAIVSVNEKLRDIMIPNWKDINTTFLTGTVSNAEEVIKMDPDIILLYGAFQKEGLENVNIPQVDFFMTDMDVEVWSLKINELMREIFGIDPETTLEKEWADAKEIVKEPLSKITENEKKTAILIMANVGDIITITAADSYGFDWFEKTGVTDLGANLSGMTAEVSMEQILEWNPDIIYECFGLDASLYLSNSIPGQDWSQVNAYKNGFIYDFPIGMSNWGSPNIDSPLTLIWMVMKNYPGSIEESFFNDYMKDYYIRQYGITLTDELLYSILDPAK